MRLTLFAVFALGTAAFAQTHSPTGSYGNILHPGVPSPGTARPPAPASRPGVGSSSFNRGHRSYGGTAVYVPFYGYGYGFDNFYPGGYAPGYGPAYAPEPPAPPDAPTPTIIINQNFQTEPVHPQFRDYTNVPLPEPGTVQVPPGSALADDQPTVFLIAMNDHTILPVIAYWVDGATLHYVTLQSVPNQVSLDQVDRDFSRKLNADRHVPFALPAAR
jgi:hypothetical protein